MTEALLKVKFEKYRFEADKVEFLGHQISANGIEPNINNVEAVVTFPTPKRMKDIRSILGLCNYYRRYIEDFCKFAKPLHTLLKKDGKFVWSDQEDNAFKAYKEKLAQAPILACPDFKSPFMWYIDASWDAAGFSLTQVQDLLKRSVVYGEEISQISKNV